LKTLSVSVWIGRATLVCSHEIFRVAFIEVKSP
ncbi:MAG: hypothetical protein ACI9K1_001179, partial [Arcticibacterium sp.]